MEKTKSIQKIVVGVDGSEAAGEALAWSIQFARQTGARIVAVFAVPPPSSREFLGLAPMPGLQLDPEFQADLESAFKEEWQPASGGSAREVPNSRRPRPPGVRDRRGRPGGGRRHGDCRPPRPRRGRRADVGQRQPRALASLQQAGAARQPRQSEPKRARTGYRPPCSARLKAASGGRCQTLPKKKC